MPNRTKLLVHLRRLSGLFDKAFRNGPDGTLEGNFALEHPTFVHHGCAFYLAGCLAFLEGEDGAYSWNLSGENDADFDAFVTVHPTPPKESFLARGINTKNMNALVEVRNAVTHNNGDLTQNRNQQSLTMVTEANLPGVVLSEGVVTLEAPLLEFIRVSTLAVRHYHGEY